MNRSPEEIQQEIDAVRRQTARKLEQLGHELDQARRQAALAASGQKRQQEISREVLDRFDIGWWVSGADRLWWHCPEQILVERVTPDEMQAIRRLESLDMIARDYGRANGSES